jgi:hypothetical protein
MRFKVFAGLLLALLATPFVNAQVVINEFVYDDGGTDDREFVELLNTGNSPVDISGWTIGGHDGTATQNNPITTIPGAVGSGTTILAAGDYYVIAGSNSVPNFDQVMTVTNGFLENDGETLELFDGAFDASNLVDGVVYEAFGVGSAGPGSLSAGMLAQVNGGPYWGPANVPDAGAGLTTLTVSRYVNGRDTNNNGRDFGIRPPTPGAANTSPTMTVYTAPNPDPLNDGDVLPGHTGSFVGLRAMTPSVVVAGLNPNAITATIPGGHTKALVGWDGAGGGNAIVTDAIFAGGAQRFDITAYLDTEDMPGSTNSSGVPFQTSEVSFYGLGGSIDAGVAAGGGSLSNVSGVIAHDNNSAVGLTGVAWYYEKVGGGVSEKLYLIDAGDGGNENTRVGNATADEWIVLQEIDLSAAASDWHRLSIQIDAAGNGMARYDDQTFNFTTAAGLFGTFNIGYRENAQDGAVLVPDYLRPPTFVQTPPSGADADFDDSGTVDGKDFLIWQANFGGAGGPTTGDATGDGQVDAADFDEWKLKFGGPPAVAAAGAVPEPAAGMLSALVVLSAAAARRRR